MLRPATSAADANVSVTITKSYHFCIIYINLMSFLYHFCIICINLMSFLYHFCIVLYYRRPRPVADVLISAVARSEDIVHPAAVAVVAPIIAGPRSACDHGGCLIRLALGLYTAGQLDLEDISPALLRKPIFRRKIDIM